MHKALVERMPGRRHEKDAVRPALPCSRPKGGGSGIPGCLHPLLRLELGGCKLQTEAALLGMHANPYLNIVVPITGEPWE